MITAHLPAGYLTGQAFAASGPVLWCAVAEGLFPDLDLIWFYLIDNRAIHHHHYWVHILGFWFLVFLVDLPLVRMRRPGWTGASLAFFAAIFAHLLLDSIAGDIKWLWPFSENFFHLIEVPAVHSAWILNFVLHPVFVLEILILGTAITVLMHTHRKRGRAE